MSEKRIILVTGVGGYWGDRVAKRLVAEGAYHVIGLGADPPTKETAGLDFIQADVRNPKLPELFQGEGVDTVCHLAFVETTRPRESAFDLNVLGTTKILAACAEAGVRKVVLKSCTAVYGARPSNPAFLTEGHSLRGSKRVGYVRDRIEIETFCSGFRQKVPDMLLTILRFASIVGPTADTPMVRFLKEPAAPSLLGFDPMVQIIHEDDVVEALVQAVVHDVPGVFNVAAQDALPLNRARALAGKPPLAVVHMFAYWGADLLDSTRTGLGRYMPIPWDYLRYSWVGDLTRMRDELGFTPRYTAEDTLREFADWHCSDRHLSQRAVLARDEERLSAIIKRRQKAREGQANAALGGEEGEGDE
jgi:UDP-glucose 4-epimerase